MNDKQKITISALIIILIASLAATWLSREPVGHAQLDLQAKKSPSDASEWMDDARRQLGLAKDVYLLASATDEVTGDSILDAVLLVGVKSTAEDRFASNIDLIVRDGKSGRFVTANLPDISGYESSLFLGDFNGDKVKDVMITAPSGGSGGSVNHSIVAFPSSVPAILFTSNDNSGAAFSGRFLDDFQVELVNSDTGRKTRVAITDTKSHYLETGVYRADGKLLKPITPHIYPYGNLEPVDLNHDGTYELKGVQKIVGAYNTDVIANVYSYWQYNNQRWTLQQLEVANLLLGSTQGSSPAGSSPQAVSKQMKSQSADVSYPQFDEMADPITRTYVNQTLESAARELVNRSNSDTPISAEYEITRSDAKILSVIFRSSQKRDNGSYPILQTINIDLQNRAILSADDLFRSDRQSRRAVNSLIAAAVKESGRTDSPNRSDLTGMYITSQAVVLYEQKGEQNPEAAQLYLPLEKATPYFNEQFLSEKDR